MLDEDSALEGRVKRSKTERRDLSIGIGKIEGTIVNRNSK